MRTLQLKSHAKINIGLLVLQKRNDGFHDIATVYQQIDFCDILRFKKTAGDVKIIASCPDLPLDHENLASKAFRLLKNTLGLTEGLEIHIEKNIPMGGGLGGGSSNAAMTLAASNELWDHPFTINELREMSSAVGSDVPFFLLGGTALGQGRGEILESLHWPNNYWIVLVCPGVSVSTAWAYQQSKIALTNEEKISKFRSIFQNFDPHVLRTAVVNDLEDVVFQRHPELLQIKEQLYDGDAFYAGMSGIGSTMFGLFHDQSAAETMRMFFSKQRGMTAFLSRPVFIQPWKEIVSTSSSEMIGKTG